MHKLELKHKRNGLDVKLDFNNSFVESVKVSLKPAIWLDLFNPEGEYLPYCCANISRIRDIFIDAARNGCYMESDQLFEAYTLIKSHNHGKLNEPLEHLVRLWEAVQNDVDKNRHHVSPLKASTPEAAVMVLSEALPLVNWNLYFGNEKNDDRRVSTRAMLNLELLKIAPAISILYQKLNQLDPGPIDGYAVCDENEICVMTSGYAVFYSENLAEEFVRLTGNKYSVRPVTISMKNGVVFNDVLNQNNTIEVLVKQKIRGGYLCKPLDGREGEAFMPFSHAASSYLSDEDALIGQSLKCVILGQEPGRDLRVSRKLVEEVQQEILQTTLQVGDVYDGVVSGIETYGVFVNTGTFTGLIHRSRMEGYKPQDFVMGEEVKVKITDNSDPKRIAIKLKEKA